MCYLSSFSVSCLKSIFLLFYLTPKEICIWQTLRRANALCHSFLPGLSYCSGMSNFIYHMSHVKYQMSYVTCQMSNVKCHMSHVKYQMSYVTCQMSNCICHMSNIKCHMSHVKCQMSCFLLQISLTYRKRDLYQADDEDGKDGFHGCCQLNKGEETSKVRTCQYFGLIFTISSAGQ